MSHSTIAKIRRTLASYGLAAAVRQARAYGITSPRNFIVYILGQSAPAR